LDLSLFFILEREYDYCGKDFDFTEKKRGWILKQKIGYFSLKPEKYIFEKSC